MDPTLHQLNPLNLEIHPVLSGFPDLTAGEYAALKASIAAQGIKVELRGVPTKEGRVAIYSGRHRRQAALELGLDTVPVLVNGIDPARLMEFVLDEVTTGRQLTKSGLVLLLFERHPALAQMAGQRKSSGRPKKSPTGGNGVNGDSESINAESSEESGYRKVAERYQVPREYFTLLGKIRHGQAAGEGALKLDPASEEAWAGIRRQIIEDQTPITRIWAGWNGKVSTAGDKAPTDYYATCERGLISLKGAFSNWKKVPVSKRAGLIQLWQELQTLIPEDLQ